MTTALIRARSLLERVSKVAAQLNSYVSNRPPISHQERELLRIGLTDAFGNPQTVYAFRTRALGDSASAALEILERHPGREADLIAPLYLTMAELDDNMHFVVESTSEGYAEFRPEWDQVLAETRDHYQVVFAVEQQCNDDGESEADATALEPWQQRMWDRESPIWTGMVYSVLSGLESLIRILSRRKFKPGRYAVNHQFTLLTQTLGEESAEEVIADFRRHMEEQGDTRGALLSYLNLIFEEVNALRAALESESTLARLDLLSEAEHEDGPPLKSLLAMVGLVHGIHHLYLSERPEFEESNVEISRALELALVRTNLGQ